MKNISNFNNNDRTDYMRILKKSGCISTRFTTYDEEDSVIIPHQNKEYSGRFKRNKYK